MKQYPLFIDSLCNLGELSASLFEDIH